jgi:dihydropteroate synthase
MAAALDQLPDDTTYIAGHLRGRSLAEVFAAEPPVDAATVERELRERLSTLSPRVRSRTWLDPGIGFGKGADPATNFALLRHRFADHDVVVGPSRKRFLRRVVAENTNSGDEDHLVDIASVSACILGARFGAKIVRVHNVALLRNALATYNSL